MFQATFHCRQTHQIRKSLYSKTPVFYLHTPAEKKVSIWLKSATDGPRVAVCNDVLIALLSCMNRDRTVATPLGEHRPSPRNSSSEHYFFDSDTFLVHAQAFRRGRVSVGAQHSKQLVSMPCVYVCMGQFGDHKQNLTSVGECCALWSLGQASGADRHYICQYGIVVATNTY
jgi:hypothetical protein